MYAGGEQSNSPCPRLRKSKQHSNQTQSNTLVLIEPQEETMVGRRPNTSCTSGNSNNASRCHSPSNGSATSTSSSSSGSSYSSGDWETGCCEPLHAISSSNNNSCSNNHTAASDIMSGDIPSKSRSSTKSWRTTLLQILLAIKGLTMRQQCLLIGLILLGLPFCVQRAIVWHKGRKAWVMSPIMHLERQCPQPAYPTLTSTDEGRAQADQLKICLTTLTDEKTKHSVSLLRRFIRWRNYDNILDLTWKSKQAYADKHGYHLFDSSDMVQTGRPAQWSKIKAVQRLLVEEKCDWALWMDADTLFMNTEKKIEDFLPADPDKDIVVAVDVPNPGYNSGSWLVKNSEFGLGFLQKWWDMKTFVRLPGQSLSGDNDAFKVLLGSIEKDEFDKHIAVPPRCTINAFAKFLRPWDMEAMTDAELKAQPWYMSENFYHKSDWLVHVPGYDNKAGTLQMLMEEIQ